jgi:predicted dehydrogenase
MAGAGALVGTGIHPIDLLCYLLDSEVEEVFAVTDEEPPRYPVDDMVYATMRFRNGTYGTVISGLLVPRSDNDVVIYGSKMKIVCKGTVGMPMQGELLVEGDAVDTRRSCPVAYSVTGMYVRAVESFNRSILENSEPLSPAVAGLEMVRVANAVIESSRRRRAVTIERDD